MADIKELLEKAINLPPAERAYIIDKLMLSLDTADNELEKHWAAEAESRIDAYERGELKAVSIKDVLGKYR
ncbi:MAG: hypothetical protein EPN93_06110 [Spirochaetes bacterium]|nr:MAG: hypothetical protein EPN93_06110 [Spirochaetota bacterium]